MRRTHVIVAILVAVASPGRAQERLADQLRKGIAEEETSQNLEKAIQAYQSIVARYDEDRKVAGSAVFRLAECYRKAGRLEQAIAAYRRVVREFPDQQAMAETSRQQLAALGASEVTDVRAVRAPRKQIEPPREVTPKSREVTPDHLRAPGEMPTTTLAETRLAMQDLENRLARARDLAAKGLMPTSDVQALQFRLQGLMQKMRDQQAEATLNQQLIVSVQKEIALVEGRIAAIESHIKVGTASPDDAELLQLRRDLLGLQRRLDELRIGARR